jgi:hypothetical protein
MVKPVNLDTELVSQARVVLGTDGTTDTLHRALDEVVRRHKLRRLADWDFSWLTPERLEEMRRPRTFSPPE